VVTRALAVAAVWLSPAMLLGIVPLVLADGTHGVWAPLSVTAASCLAVVILAAPWAALPPGAPATVPDLLRYRDPEASRVLLLPLGIAASGVALLFLWAQLAAARELARATGWPEPAAIGGGVVALALLAGRERAGPRAVAAAGGLAVIALGLPLVVVLLATDPVWPRVFEAVATRPRVAFDAGGPWARTGQPVRGPRAEAVLSAAEAQRVVLLGPGRIRVEPWEGGGVTRDVAPPLELTLRPGDRLIVPDGFPVRFEAGRAIPGAPASGPEWVEPDGASRSARSLAGLAVTLLVGALGLTPLHAVLPAGRPGGDRAAALGTLIAGLGVGGAVLWGLYAAWLTPEVYTGGVVGSEVYGLPAALPALGSIGPALRDLAWVGLAAGSLGAGLAALRGVPRTRAPGLPGLGRTPALVPAVAALAGLLAAVVPAGPWPPLVAAFGLAASACAPAAVLGCWRQRLGPAGLAVGATLGLGVFAGLTAIRLAGVGGGAEGWLPWLAAWPAVVAAPLNLAAAWLGSPGPRPPVPPPIAGLAS
jgi:hypothetical protein